MIESCLPELIVEHRFGPLRIGQPIDEVRSILTDVPNLDRFWQGQFTEGDHFDFQSLLVSTEKKNGRRTVNGLFVYLLQEEWETDDVGKMFRFDFRGLDVVRSLSEAMNILLPFGPSIIRRTNENVSLKAGSSTLANFNLNDELDAFGPARLYNLELSDSTQHR